MVLSPKQWVLIGSYLLLAVLLAGFLCLEREAAVGVPVLSYHQVNDEDDNALTIPRAAFE